MKPTDIALKKEIGLLGSFSLGFADVGADIFLALGLIATYALGAMPLAIIAAAAVYLLTGLAYAELSSAIPVSGGVSAYGERAFGRFAGFLGGWGLILDYTIDIALFAVAAAGYLSFFFPQIRGAFTLVTAFLIIVLVIINLFGIRESSFVNSVLTLGAVALIIVLSAVGFSTSFDMNMFLSGIQPIEVSPGIHDFLYSITLAMVAFIGVESISQGAEETKNPERTLPRATLMAVIMVILFALAMSVLALGVVTPKVLADNVDNPLVAVASALPFSGILVPIVAFAGFAICLVSANTGIIGVSRVTYSMSHRGFITRRFKWVHHLFGTPWVSIIVFSIIAIYLASFGDMFFLGELYAFGALTAYMISNLSLIRLRFTEPTLARPFKMPLNLRLGRAEVPVLGVLGVIGCGVMLALVALLHETGRTFALIWFAGGICYFLIYPHYRRAFSKLPAESPAPAEAKAA
ncbi:MAG TPA: APC family permease [Candidatus Bilamarchaeum sp.]|nr:APC family permease [Candidatus Bilamarchaeum sp.]